MLKDYMLATGGAYECGNETCARYTGGQAGEQEPLACGALFNRYLEKCHFKAL